MHITARSFVVAVARWTTLAVGVGLTTLSFVRLVEVRNRVADASPWWWLGLIGAAVTVLALGLPWTALAQRADDAGSRRSGS